MRRANLDQNLEQATIALDENEKPILACLSVVGHNLVTSKVNYHGELNSGNGAENYGGGSGFL